MANDKSAYLKNIKHVGIYLRKSRISADQNEAETLDKHRAELLAFVEENKLEPQWFEEIVSGTSDHRTEFLRMLELTALEVFDAIVVINWDRLTRNEVDGARLSKTLRDSETLVIQLNPFEIIDLNNEGDVDKTSFMTFFASWEARQIARRNRAGKVRGALAGKWVNPGIPYGYDRDKKTGHLKINEPQAEVFRRIFEMYISGMQTKAIWEQLNLDNVPSPKGGEWNDSVVRRMIVDEVYIGKAIFGKAKYIDRKMKKDKPREEWIIVPSAHPAIITEEQRNEVIELFQTRKRVNGQAQHGYHIFSGLLKCPVCGGSLHFANTARGVWIRKCGTVDGIGTRCANTDKGVAVAVVTKAIADILEKHKATLLNPVDEAQDAQDAANAKIKKIQADLAKMDKAADRLLELYEYGDIERAVYNERKARRLEKRAGVERALAALYERVNKNTTAAERIKEIDAVVEAIRNNDGSAEDTEKINKLLRDIIGKIVYHNDGDTLTLEVLYN